MTAIRHILCSTASLVLLLSSVEVAFGQIVPDGRTATSVTTAPSGHATVNIAPASGPSLISKNSFSSFSVAPAGAAIDNRTVSARTILSEVTSNNPSLLQGPVEVLGARAHFILANPNGIVADGVSFRNVGGLVLSTGQASSALRTISPGVSQENVVLETSGGRIDITARGVSAAVSSLQMIAGKIRVDGTVENTLRADDLAGLSHNRTDLRLIAGGSSVEFDSAVMPNNELEQWGRLSKKPRDNAATAIEITARGTLKANTIRLVATDKGAGVSHAGSGLAGLGDFTIDANGQVQAAGSVKAHRNVRIAAQSISLSSDTARAQSEIKAINGAVTLLAASGGISNIGVLVSGTSRDLADTDSKGGATLRAAGDVSLLTRKADQLAIVFSSGDDLSVSAGGSISNNTGRLLSNAMTRLFAGGDIRSFSEAVGPPAGRGVWQIEESYGESLWYTFWQQRRRFEHAHVSYGEERVGGQQAYVVGADVSLLAGGSIVNEGGMINANGGDHGRGDVFAIANDITTKGLLLGSLSYNRNCAFVCSGSGRSTVRISGGAINAARHVDLNARRAIINDGGQLTAFGTMMMSAPDVRLRAIRTTSVHLRPGGLFNFWSGSYPFITESDEGGILSAPGGAIRVDSLRPVQVSAGQISAAKGLELSAGQQIVAPPDWISIGQSSDIGWFRSLVRRR